MRIINMRYLAWIYKASRDAVVEACRKSGALGFIEKLDHGFGQKIGQDGAKLSGGERQKIAGGYRRI